MTTYESTFGHISFTTRHTLEVETLNAVIAALEAEASENLAYDHWHPEIAGPLQTAIHFLQTRKVSVLHNSRRQREA